MLSRCSRYIAVRLDHRNMHFPPITRFTLLRTAPTTTLYNVLRAFTCTPTPGSKPLPPRRPILDSEIVENFLKGSGPGGQKINKTSSAVQLLHIPTGIVVKCQDTRSRTQNRKTARRILQDRIEELELGEEARTRVKARERSKKKASADKKKRRKYKALEENKDEQAGTDGSDGNQEGVGRDVCADGQGVEETVQRSENK